jgi:raffinose/stachyose/melibiose transport system permease protein
MFPAIHIAIIPTIIVYTMFSNQIVDGLTTGAVKG